jgi:two-component system, OmpR family, sensor histidine kinase CiaH
MRLTAWSLAMVVVFVGGVGYAVYATVRDQLTSEVDSGLVAAGQRAALDVDEDVVRGRLLGTNPDLPVEAAQGSYWILVYSNGVVRGTAGAYALGLPDPTALSAARPAHADVRTISRSGHNFRLYTLPVRFAGRTIATVQIGRSLAPEEAALDNVVNVVVIAAASALLLGAVATWLLAGRALGPVERAFERERRFAADASHELRTPLAVIQANAEFAHVTHPHDEEIEAVLSEAERLSSLVATLLSVAQGEHLPTEMVTCPLDVIVAAAVETLTPLAHERQVSMSLSGEDCHVLGDPGQLHQLVVILVDNALRYTDAGGHVIVTVTPTRSEQLRVQDTGIGIPIDAQPYIFQRFYRADSARNRQTGGRGLGLALAQDIISRHKGKIDYTSIEGEGTTITVTLPTSRHTDPAPRSLPAETAHSVSPDPQPSRLD